MNKPVNRFAVFDSRRLNVFEHDVIVAGAGIAGYRAAFAAKNAKPHLRVAQLNFASDQSHGGCSWKTHGINAAMNPADSIESHFTDTLRGGGMISDPELARVLCQDAPIAIWEMEALGVVFDQNGKHYQTGTYGGVTTARSVHSSDRAGKLITDCLRNAARDIGVTTFHKRVVLNYLVSDGQVFGAICINLESGTHEIHLAPKLISALGAGACTYPITTISADKTATGLIAFLDAGGRLVDMEQVQFHPTGLNMPGMPGHGEIIEEEVRSQGAKLLNKHGDRFMPKYDKLGEMATRDIVARSCYLEVKNGRGSDNGGVFLDLSEISSKFLSDRFPFMSERFQAHGINLAGCKVLETSPSAHFLMGGIPIDVDGRTEIDGLYACGEDAGGIHGGNRLGGNGVADALVFGARAGFAAAHDDVSVHGRADLEQQTMICSESGPLSIYEIDTRVKRLMWDFVGPARDDAGLLEAKANLKKIWDQLNSQKVSLPACKLTSYHLGPRKIYQKIRLAQSIISASLERTNSVGAHMRTDADHENAIYNTLVSSESGVISSARVYKQGTMHQALSPREVA